MVLILRKYYWDQQELTHLTKEDQYKQGSFYTPKEIAFEMADKTEWKWDADKEKRAVLDPTCGYGNLLKAMMDTYEKLEEDDLYGVDIDPEAVKICIAAFPNGHFQVGNCLEDPIDNNEWWKKDPFESWEDYKNRTNYREIKSGEPAPLWGVKKDSSRNQFCNGSLYNDYNLCSPS